MDFGVAGFIADLVGPIFLLVAALAFVARRRKRKAARSAAPESRAQPYRVYTRAYDVEVAAQDVVALLPEASPDCTKGWLVRGDGEWHAQIEAAWALRQRWMADLDTVRARHALALHAVGERGAVLSLLVDQSGLMRGERIAAVAALAGWTAELAAEAGVRTEILGFSTAGWHGGHARDLWRRRNSPARPGRLCALMHVVYKSADERFATKSLDMMLHPDLLRENVDGEAIVWAAARLEARPEPLKLLVVLSDGAPVDDATMLANGDDYLVRHLNEVIGGMEQGRIVLGAIGIEHRVDEYYPCSVVASRLDDLPDAMADLCHRMASQAGAMSLS